MSPTKLLIFGKPQGGTPLMLARPRIAIDLPLKILVWEDAQGQVWVSANSALFFRIGTASRRSTFRRSQWPRRWRPQLRRSHELRTSGQS